MRAVLCAGPLLLALVGCGNRPAVPASTSATNTNAPEATAAPGAAPETDSADAVRPAEVRLPSGTVLKVRLAQSLDTSRNRAGDRFEATLASPVSHDGKVILPKNTTFHGHLTTSTPSGRLRHRGYLGLTLDSFQLNGQTYKINTSGKTMATGSHKKRNLALIGGGSGLGALIGGLAGGGKAALIGAGAGAGAGTVGALVTGKKNVHLPAETLLTFTLRAPVEVKSL